MTSSMVFMLFLLPLTVMICIAILLQSRSQHHSVAQQITLRVVGYSGLIWVVSEYTVRILA